MKTILFMRHGKSSWDMPCSDFERILNSRGQEEAEQMGSLLRESGILPQQIFCSAATRTVQTFEKLSSSWKHPWDVSYHEDLYHSSVDTLLLFATQFDQNTQVGLILAHNPAMAELQSRFKMTAQPHMPTAAIIVAASSVDLWTDFTAQTIESAKIIRPKDLS